MRTGRNARGAVGCLGAARPPRAGAGEGPGGPLLPAGGGGADQVAPLPPSSPLNPPQGQWDQGAPPGRALGGRG